MMTVSNTLDHIAIAIDQDATGALLAGIIADPQIGRLIAELNVRLVGPAAKATELRAAHPAGTVAVDLNALRETFRTDTAGVLE